jgi:hypothetical protein
VLHLLHHVCNNVKLYGAMQPSTSRYAVLQLVEAYKKKAVMREGMRSIGRQTLFVAGVAALYFGVELGAGMAREQHGHWANTAAAGAVAGGYLGARGAAAHRMCKS